MYGTSRGSLAIERAGRGRRKGTERGGKGRENTSESIYYITDIIITGYRLCC